MNMKKIIFTCMLTLAMSFNFLIAQNNSLYFDGTDDYVQIPDLTETTEGTIEMWILPDATGADNLVFGNGCWTIITGY